jgi:hypothetical protein
MIVTGFLILAAGRTGLTDALSDDTFRDLARAMLGLWALGSVGLVVWIVSCFFSWIGKTVYEDISGL